MVFYHKGLWVCKTPLSFVACDRKAAILRVQIWSAHESDVVGIEGVAIAELTRETVVAMNDLGRKVVGAISGHQQLVAKRPKMRQHTVLFKALKDRNKHRIECVRGDGIAQRSDRIIPGNLLDPQQGMRVILASVVLQGALVV